MKKISLLLALGLMLSICAGCGAKPAETTLPPVETTTAPVETTTAPPETTVPPTTEPPESVVIDFAMELPEGFDASVVEENRTVYISPNAPMDLSTITVEKLEMDESVLTMTQEEFLTRFEAPEETQPTDETEETEETDPSESSEPSEPAQEYPEEVNFYSLETTEIDGWPALFCDYSLVYENRTAHVYRYEVVVNYNNYVFTFTDTTDANKWLGAYEACVPEIDLILDTEGIELDYSGLEHYTLDCGLELYAEQGLESHKVEGFTACLGNRNVIMLLMADDKQDNNLTGMTLDDYADLLRQTNDLDNFKWDTYGNLSVSFYSTDDNGISYYNVIALKETSEDFWVCQMACSADDQAEYARAFSLWASSVAENG